MSRVVLVAIVVAAAAFAQSPWEKARDAARADLERFRAEADREIVERRARIAALRTELIDVAARSSDAEAAALVLEARLDAATVAAAERGAEAADLDVDVRGAQAALLERGPGAESRATETAFEHVIAAAESRIADAGAIRVEGNLVRFGDLQVFEVLPGDRAVVGRAGRAAPVGPLSVAGIGAIHAAIAAGSTPPFVPIDPTGKLDATPPPAERDLAGWFAAGGPIVVVIVVLGGLGMVLALARLALVLRERAPDPRVVAEARARAVVGDRAGAAAVLRARPGAVHAALAEAVMVEGADGAASREAGIEQVLLRTVDRFERFLHMIAVIAATSPLLGLLGTVVGMIRMFDALTLGAGGASHVEALSGGIGEALVTTEAGLLFAIPLILLHAAISARADRLEAGLEDAALTLTAPPEDAS